jgi:hypothetical protein
MKQTPITINETGLQGRWSITFIGDYATITTIVDGLYDEAIVLAENMLNDYYGFDLSDWQTEIELI